MKENKLSHFDTTELREISRLNLESKISGRIIEVHSQNHNADVNIRKGAYYSIIPLEDFVNILKSNPQELLDNEDYYLFIIQELLNQYYTEFCLEITEDLENEEKELTEGNKEKLSNYLAQINGLDKSSLLKFIQSILPNRSVKLGTIKEFKDFNVQQDEFKYSFLQILLELIESTGIIGKNLSWKDDDDLRYTATAIHAGQRSKHQICKNIFKNINDLDIEVPYESNMLITASIDVTSIKDQLNKQYKVEEELGDKKNNIVKWFDIGLISLDNAKDKIG